MEVQILSRKLIKPSVPTPNHLPHLNISFLDEMAPPGLVPLIFYYPFDINDEERDEAENLKKRCDRLEKSVSNVLTRFYPLAGRFIKEKLLVDCNDQGVEYIETQVLNAKLDEFLRGKRDPKMLNNFFPSYFNGPESETTPLAAIQVNIFGCTGLAIAICVSHRIGDAFTGIAFINALATASRAGGGLDQVIQPCFDLPSIIPARSLSHLKPSDLPSKINNNKSKLVTKTFLFDANALSTLKSKDVCGLSRLAIVSGVIWRALISVSMVQKGHLRPSFLVHSLNLRGKTLLQTPENCMGNFYTLVGAKFTPNDEAKMEWHDLAGLVRGAIRNTIDEYREKARNEDEIYAMVMKSLEEVGEESCKEDVDVFMFTSLCGFPLYEADFGWGKPSWTSSINQIFKMVTLFDNKNGDGIEAWVTLIEQDMFQFQQDPDIIAFTNSSI